MQLSVTCCLLLLTQCLLDKLVRLGGVNSETLPVVMGGVLQASVHGGAAALKAGRVTTMLSKGLVRDGRSTVGGLQHPIASVPAAAADQHQNTRGYRHLALLLLCCIPGSTLGTTVQAINNKLPWLVSKKAS